MTTSQVRDAQAETDPLPLPGLPPGRRAIITSVGRADDGAGLTTSAEGAQGAERTETPAARRLRRRLLDLGLIPGRTIEALRRAPLGDPTVFLVADYELCLRKRDAAHILVTPLDDAEEQR